MKKIIGWLRRLAQDQQGTVAVLVGLSLTMLVGFVGLGVEAGLWYEVGARQVSSSTAAIAAANALRTGGSLPAGGTAAKRAQAEAWTVAATNGFPITGSGQTTCAVAANQLNPNTGTGDNTDNTLQVTVNTPPCTGAYTASSGAVEVIISQPQTRLFSNLFLSSILTISARSVAAQSNGNACVLVLNAASAKDASLTGGTVVLSDCNMQVNSNNVDAFDQTGGNLTANAIDIVGNYHSTNNNLSVTPTTGVSPIPDPYTGLYAANGVSALTSQSCPAANNGRNINTNNITLSPGVYCNTLNASGGHTTMNPGVYIIQGGKIQVSGGSLTGTGVTIILTKDSGNHYATAAFTGGQTDLRAPSTGAWAGMLFYQDPNAPTSSNLKSAFTGGGNSLLGTLYFPTQTLDYTGGAVASACTQIVSYNINFTGGGTVGSSCANTGVNPISSLGGGPVTLVE